MARHREILRKARRQVHEHLSDPVLYLADSSVTEPVSTTARLHLRFAQAGELLRGGFAEREEINPTVVFLEPPFKPVAKAFVITEDMGAWRIDHDLPANDITTSCQVVEVSRDKAISYGWSPDLPWYGFPAPAVSA